MELYPAAIATALALVAVGLLRWHLLAKRLRLPPGPPGLPLLDNLLDMPTTNQWLVFAGWAKKYGDIISLRVLGHTIVVLNSARDVREILIKRGMQCGSRMRYAMAAHAGWEHDIHLVSPTDFRTMKRYATKNMSSSGLSRFVDVQESEIVACLRRILHQSSVIDPEQHLKRMVGSATLRIAYGYTVTSSDDEFVEMSEQAIDMLFVVTAPGWIVDLFPWMRHLPSWMLGPKYTRTVARSRALMHAVRTIPIEWTKNQLAAGTGLPSLAADLLSSPEQQDNDVLVGFLADLYTGAVDTTLSTSLTLLLALALYPEVQARAQQEVDSVTHGERLPTSTDRLNLPYVEALVKEVYRFRGVVNMGFPHRATQDIEYKGLTIPKDALISPNIWSVFHDPAKYPDPYTFNPERFLGDDSLAPQGVDVEVVNEDPTRYVFGFEPRKCLGRHFADSMVFLLAAKLLATCDVSDVVTPDGRPITQDTVEYTGGFVSRPAQYKCTVKPRLTADVLLAAHDHV